jgi:hypothetical protein
MLKRWKEWRYSLHLFLLDEILNGLSLKSPRRCYQAMRADYYFLFCFKMSSIIGLYSQLAYRSL